MATIITRQTSGGGVTVKGSPLTNAEMDTNLININIGITSGAEITGGTINGASIGATTPSTGRFTSLTTDQTTFNLINTTATTLNIGGAATTLAIGASTGTLTINNAGLIHNSTSYTKVAAGTNAQRPGSASNGMIRYNSDISSFEGYASGAWSSLGGVKSVDGLTYIIAETSAGVSNDELEFYAADSSLTTSKVGGWNQSRLLVSTDMTVTGNLTVNGTTTTINSTTISVDDKNIELGSVTSPTNTTADGGGITLKGATDKTLNWVNSTSAWTSSEHLDLASGKAYYINGTSVLSGSTLGSGVTGSSLTSVGTLTSITTSGNLTFTGTGNRITGDFSNATATNRVSVQSSTTNSPTIFGLLPNGTSTVSYFVAYANSNPTNTNGLAILSTNTESRINSLITGTGSYVPMTFYTSGSERLRIDTSGNIGIGTSSPSSFGKFSVHGTAGQLFTVTDSMSGTLFGVNDTSGIPSMEILDTGDIRLTAYSGNVGIGTNTPTTKLDIRGSSGTLLQISDGTRTLYAGADATGPWFGNLSNHDLRLFTNSAERIRINAAGAVGIGKTAHANNNLDVLTTSMTRTNGTSGIAETWSAAHDFWEAPTYSGIALRYHGSAYPGTRAGLNLANLGVLLFQNCNNALITTNGDIPMVFATQDAERLRLSSSGNTVTGNLTVTGNVLPKYVKIKQTTSDQWTGMGIAGIYSATSADGYSYIDFQGRNDVTDSSMIVGHRADYSSFMQFATQPAGTNTDRRATKLTIDAEASFNCNLYVGSGQNASSLYMADTDEGQRILHCNSNRIGFLNSSGSWGAYCNDDGTFSCDFNMFAAGSQVLTVAGGYTMTGGARITSFNLGTTSGATITPNALSSNYQYVQNNGAGTINAPAADCAIDILLSNTTGASTITFSGYTVIASAIGDPLTTSTTARFIISIRRIAGISTYTIKQIAT